MVRTSRGFITIASICIIALFGYISFALISSAQPRQNTSINKTKLTYLKSLSTSKGDIQSQSPTIPTKPIVRVARAVPVPNILIAPDPICSFDNVDEAITRNADTTYSDNLKLTNAEEADNYEDYDPYAYVPVEKEPYTDFNKLQKKAIYLNLAKSVRVAGKVNVRVLIGKNGIPKKTFIESTDSDIFNNAAMQAIMNSVFTPAIQENQSIDYWMSIQIVFRLP